MHKSTKIIGLALATGLLATAGLYASTDRYKSPTVRAYQEGTPQTVPGKVTNPTATFAEGSTSGTINFTMPEGLFSTAYPAVGWVKYRITEANVYPEVEYANGEAEYGQEVSAPVTLPAGYHSLLIYAYNEVGSSSPYYPYLSIWVGPGTPSNVTGVQLTADGTTMNLSWNPVTTANNSEAFFNPSEVTYTIVRTPGDVTVSENQSGTTFTETLSSGNEAIGYRYSVAANFRGQSSTPTFSNGVAVGTNSAPWSTDFSEINDFLTFTASPNNDSYCWQYDTFYNRVKLPYYSFSSTPGNDDWLITPGFRLEAGKLYPVSFTFASYSKSYVHTLEVKAGTTPTAEGLTISVIPDTEISTDSPYRDDAKELKGFLLAPTTGVYYIGLHDKSNVRVYDCYAYGFSIGDGMAGTSPEAISNLSITSDPDAVPAKAVISFTAPTTDINGSNITSLSDVKIYRDGALIHTFNTPAAGAQLSYTDVLPAGMKGTHTYRIVPSNASGAGRPTEYTTFVGDYRLHPPYTNNLESEADAAVFTVIDADGYGSSYYWTYETSNQYFSCNSTTSIDCDDWLILPAIWLKGGFRYTFSAELKSYWAGDQVPFEVYMGTAPTVDGMTTKIGELKDADSNIGNSWQTFTFNADPATDGDYYLAIRYLGSGNACKLCVNHVSVNGGLSVEQPAAITDLAAEADFGGTAKVNISFTAPTQSMSGNSLSSLNRIELYRDDTLVKTFTSPTPGAALSYEDTGMTKGYHTYTVTPYGETAGESSQVSVFVGTNTPSAPFNAVVTEDADQPGTVTISWEAPSTDADGNTINQELVKYNIYSLSIFGYAPQLIFEEVEGTSHTFQAIAPGEQHFVWYRVKAVTDGGESASGAETDVLAAGESYGMPFVESFTDGYLSYEFTSERVDSDYPVEWYVYSDRDFYNLVPQDNDNGVLGMYAPYTIGNSRLITGKIDLSDAENPVASIWFRAVKNSSGMVALEVMDCSAETPSFVRLAEKPQWDNSYPEGWVKIEAPLTAYKGKTVQIGVVGYAYSQNYIFFDNLRVSQQYDHNLVATGISAPARMYPGEEAEVTVTFQNYGAQAATGYTVDLYRNDELVESRNGSSLAADKISEVVFTEIPDVTMPEEFTYYAHINFAADQQPDNNTTEVVTVSHRLPNYPVVNDLAGTSDYGVNNLTWTAPEVPAVDCVPTRVTEDFESFPSFAKADLDDWKLVDADGEEFGGFGELTLPGIAGKVSYFVMDNAHEALPVDPEGMLKAHSGTKYLASGWVEGATGVNDDWLISPMVSATSSALSLWAKSYDRSLPETFEVLYSTTGRDITNFKRLELCEDVPAQWTEYQFTLPLGTRYFAVRCVSNDKFMLFIDDITYTPVDDSEPMEVRGFNVYRDGVKLNSMPLLVPSYSDSATATGEAYTYAVSTVLNLGESRLSNEVQIVTSSIDAVSGSTIHVSTIDGAVIIYGAEGLTAALYDASGRTIASTVCAATQRIPVPTGVVLLTVGPNSYKLLVK